MTDAPSTLDQIRDLIHVQYEIDPQTLDADKSLADFGLDSLSTAELIFAIEDHFDISYPDNRTDVRTLAELTAVVEEARHSPTPAAAPTFKGTRPAAGAA